MAKYRKTLVAVAAIVLTGLNVIYGTNSTVQLIIAVAAALGIYAVPNEPRV